MGLHSTVDCNLGHVFAPLDIDLGVLHDDEPLARVVVDLLPLAALALDVGGVAAHLAERDRPAPGLGRATVGSLVGIGGLAVGLAAVRSEAELPQQGAQRGQGSGDDAEAALEHGPDVHDAEIV